MFYLPHINPVRYVDLQPDLAPQYMSRHMDDFLFEETIYPWQQKTKFYQHWQTSDTISQQVTTDTGPVTLRILNSEGDLITAENFTQKLENAYRPGTFLYEHNLSLASFEEGIYFLQLAVGDLVLQSEPLIILQQIPTSLLVRFKHYEYFSGVEFGTGFHPSLRIPGTLVYQRPGHDRAVYEDQPKNLHTLKSTPYRVWRLNVGTSEGVPDYLIDTINVITGCSEISIDGRLFAVAEGADWEESAEDDYPMRGWTIELRERQNRGARSYENENIVNGLMAVVINTDSKGFGNTNGSDIYQLKDIQ